MDYAGQAHQVYRGRSIISKTFINGRDVLFLISHFRDVIQREHRAGRFYEPDELNIIKSHFQPGDVFGDIGSNVGNHAVFVGLFLQPEKVICIEPNKDVIPTLRANVMLNNLERICDLQHLGIGLSDSDDHGMNIQYRPNNTGAGQLTPGDGDIEVRRGDAIFAGQRVNFLKIDVEGMELNVLAGLEETITQQRPKVFIEIQNENIDTVVQYFDGLDYTQTAEWRRYPQNTNLLFVPTEATP